MIEITRQIVLFGDFKSIGFEIGDKLKEMLSKYSLYLCSTRDIDNNLLRPVPVINPLYYQNIQPLYKNNMRPILMSSDNSLNVFIGANRLYIEENNVNLDTYSVFIDKVKDIISNILSNFKNVNINRIGMNGQFELEDEAKMNEWFDKTFKETSLYTSSSSYEYLFKVTSRVNDKKLNTKINQIIQCNKIQEVLPNNTNRPILYVRYDYNTVINPNASFSFKDIEIFLQNVLKFKKKIAQ